MNYILLDLEWNNAYYKKIHGFVNEIVEFGAIKLDDNFNKIDSFNVIVRSALTKNLSNRFKELTGITNETMRDGVDFKTALESYKNWAGENIITLTWSDSDLYVLYDNCLYFTDSFKNACIGNYADLQKIFHKFLVKMGTPEKNQMSLSNAAERLKIDINEQSLHHAVDDSFISAMILKKCYNPSDFADFVIDTNEPEFYKRLRFKAYYINDINDPNINKSELYVNCDVCGARGKRLGKFNFKNKSFSAAFFCKNCNKQFRGFISFRKFYDRVDVKRKARPIS